jgi:hypothetical protein
MIALLGCSESSKPPPTSQPTHNAVAKYFETRDSFIQKFETSAATPDDRPELSELAGLMKAIVGPVNIEGFSGNGDLNLETLVKELGFGQADGLAFRSKEERLFVTTDEVLKRYVEQWPGLPKDLKELSGTGEFYRKTFSSDAAVTLYAEVPVTDTDPGSFVRAFLGLTAQDIGPFVPKSVFVFVSKGGHILAVYSPVATEIAEIPQCRSEWDEFEKKSAEAYEAYKASGLRNQQAFDQNIKLEEQGFEAYHRCYDREARNQEFFGPLKTQVQAIADRLRASR